MTEKIRIKRGNTLVLGAKYALSLVGYTIRSQVRSGEVLIDEFVITITDDILGEYTMRVDDTSEWPLGGLLCDIEYTTDTGEVKSTETFAIEVLKEITR